MIHKLLRGYESRNSRHLVATSCFILLAACGSPASAPATGTPPVSTIAPITSPTPTSTPAQKPDRLRLDSPLPEQVVRSPLEIRGEARGTWFFEASFPVKLLDAEGHELSNTHARAQGEWMTQAFVPYRATIAFATPSSDHGTLVLEKDNPSGMPEQAEQLRVPVRFARDVAQ
jgi:hypothetical protein